MNHLVIEKILILLLDKVFLNRIVHMYVYLYIYMSNYVVFFDISLAYIKL